jgi:hypothetical protein
VTYTAGTTYYFTGVASPLWSTSSSYASIPFIVQTSPWTDSNGITVNPGVYMDAAYIRDATITGAKILNATIDSAKVSSLTADKIASGSIAVGRYIQSPNFVSGTGGTGWRIETDTGGLGKAEFNTVTVRGTVYASAGTFAGSLSGATGTFAGALSAATGTFSGALSAASGTFTGDLTGANMKATANLYVGSGTSTTSPYLRLAGATQQMTVFDGYVNRVTIGNLGAGQYGMIIRNGNNQRVYSSADDVFTPYAFDTSGLGLHPGNIGTYMQSGTIDTARVANQSITAMNYGSVTANKDIYNNTSNGNVASVSITMDTSSNSGVVVTATFVYFVSGYTTNSNISCSVSLLNKNLAGLPGATYSISLSDTSGVLQIVGFDPSSSGLSTYRLSVSALDGESSSHFIRLAPIYMTAIGGKR